MSILCRNDIKNRCAMKDQGHGSHSETVLGQESIVETRHEISSDPTQNNEHPYYYSLTARMRMSEILDVSWGEFCDFISVDDVRFYDRDYFCLWFAAIIKRWASNDPGFFVRTNVFSDFARRKRVDIECGFEAEGKPLCSCAVLLRSVKDDNAFTGKMFRIYKDLYFLESLLERQGEGACGYSECRFYMLTPVEAFRKSYASCEDSSSFGLDLETDKYVRYHEQELFFKKTYPVSWYPRHGERLDGHFLEIDLNKIVDCIVGVYRGYDAIRMLHMECIGDTRPTGGRGRHLFRAIDYVKDENCIVGVYDDDKCCRCLIYRLGIITGREYSDFLNGNSIYNIEAVSRLSEMPFAKAELQPWTIEKGKVLYVSDIRVRELASVAICDVLSDFLVIIAEKMGGNTLRVRIEDGKLIEYFSKSDTYRAAGKEKWCDSTGRSQVAYYYETNTLDLLPDWWL